VVTPSGVVDGGVNPVIVNGLVVPATAGKGVVDHDDHTPPPLVEVAYKYTYDVIADPLFDVGAVKFTDALELPPVAAVIVGTNGEDT
jgi:hypothetical protein